MCLTQRPKTGSNCWRPGSDPVLIFGFREEADGCHHHSWLSLSLSAFGLQMLLLSQDYGKHLLGVEDLLQKHALVEADIAIQADRVKAVSTNATKYSVNNDGEQHAA